MMQSEKSPGSTSNPALSFSIDSRRRTPDSRLVLPIENPKSKTENRVNDPNRSGFAQMSALLGAILWVSVVAATLFEGSRLDLLALLLLLAMMVFVPLGIDLLSSPSGNSIPYRLARFLQPFGALMGAVSILLPVGTWSGLLASAWLVETVLLGLVGLDRLLRNGRAPIEEHAITAALLYLPIGAAWLVASRLGMAPLGFGGTIALLTAIHFHYAGFIAPLLAGMGGRMVARTAPSTRRLYGIAACGIIAGPILVALGITLSSIVEVLSAVILAISVTIFAIISLTRIAPLLSERRARILLRISAIASIVAMLFALLYAISSYLEQTLISIPEMAIVHGCVNALFALAGLLSWSIIRPQPLIASHRSPSDSE